MAEMVAKLAAVLEPAKEPMGHGINVSVRPKRGEGLGAIGRAEGHRGLGRRAVIPRLSSNPIGWPGIA